MFKDMINTLKVKYVEMILFAFFCMLGNTIYWGYFRPQDVLWGALISFLIYTVWASYMRKMEAFSIFMPQREKWELGEAIVANKWMYALIIVIFTYMWWTGIYQASALGYVFLMLYGCAMAVWVDKARYLENE